jgi:hypothetical protein
MNKFVDRDEFPKLILLDWQEGDDWLVSSKGWFDHNLIELANGNRYQVCFFDNIRLGQHLNDNARNGQPFFIENNLIVLSEVTIENMQKAIVRAEKQGFFENLKPINL